MSITGVVELTLTRSSSRLSTRSPKTSRYAFGVQPGTLDTIVGNLERRNAPVRGPVEHAGGDRSIYLEDPEGNVVEAWDFFDRGEGAEQGTDALAQED